MIIGLISLLTVIRHTRAEEEAGRRELIGATVVGRHAAARRRADRDRRADLVLGVLIALGMIGYGLPAAGSVAFGLALALAGWMFAAVGGGGRPAHRRAPARPAASRSPPSAAAFLLRAAGDVGGAGDGVLAVLAVADRLGAADAPVRRRALVGVRPARPVLVGRWSRLGVRAVGPPRRRRRPAAGPARPGAAAPRLRSPLALAWRLHRGLLLGWIVGFAVIGVVARRRRATASTTWSRTTSSSRDILDRLGGAGALHRRLPRRDRWASSALAAGGYAIQAALRLRAEEAGLRAEPLLRHRGRPAALGGQPPGLRAARHRRWCWRSPGWRVGLAYGPTPATSAASWPGVLAGALVQLPAVWVLAGARGRRCSAWLPRLRRGWPGRRSSAVRAARPARPAAAAQPVAAGPVAVHPRPADPGRRSPRPRC